MPKPNRIPIKYTSRDFDSIKRDLEEYASRYYGDVFRDFSEASFGALVLDSVAYVGDIMSYYLDYQISESFLDTASEYDNVLRHAESMGYKHRGTNSSYGTVAMYIQVPSNSDGTAPNTLYLPTLKRGSTFTAGGSGTFTLIEDVRFDDINNDVVASRFDSSSGQTTFFAVRAYGQVVSGVYRSEKIDLSGESYQRFKRVVLEDSRISEIINVEDSYGNKYYEVDNLTQEVVFLETTNRNAKRDGVRSILKPYIASRRFAVEHRNRQVALQFGHGSESTDTSVLVDPSKIVLGLHGKRNYNLTTFDPSKLIGTDKMGISPSGETLTVSYRANDNSSMNVGVGQVNSVMSSIMIFDDPPSLDADIMKSTRISLEVFNEEPIVGTSPEYSVNELKHRIKGYYSAQGRAVTKQDYESLIYNMPGRFGSVARVNIINDPSSSNRRISLYTTSLDSSNRLVKTSSVVKNNIKSWILGYKSLNDIIDIHDAKVINFGIDFKLITNVGVNKYDIMTKAIETVKDYFSDIMYIGEPLYITNIYNIINKIPGVSDVKRVKIFNKSGGSYSDEILDFDEIMSRDGSYFKIPQNAILELKFPNIDIKGVIG